MEQISIQRIAKCHPKIRSVALLAYQESVKKTPVGVHPFITETLRSFKRQDELYQQGRTTDGPIVTYAKAGQSYHNYGLALDFVILLNDKEHWKIDDNWMKVVEIFKSHGFTAGIDWKGKKQDAPHFEMTFGNNWKDLLIKHNSGKVDAEGYVII